MRWGGVRWLALMFAIVLSANRYFESGHSRIYRTGKRPDRPREAVAWFYQQRANPNGIPADALFRAKEYASRRMAKSAHFYQEQSIGWQELGPGNVGGRVRAIAVHPTNHLIMYVGAVAGGIWKTTDGGNYWYALDDFMTNLAVCALAIDPGNPDILYAGTGEGYYNIDALRGAGIFKTTNGGNSWRQIPGTANDQFYYVNKIAIHPFNPDTLLAATRSGIYRSLDSGETWTMVETGGTSATRALEVYFHPTDPNIALATFGSFYGDGVYRSVDTGATWSKVTSGLPTSHGRVVLAISPSNPNIMYASITNNSDYTLLGLYKSSDAGATWQQQNSGSPVDYLSYGNNGSSGQGWYDHTLAVHPQEPNTIWVGGVDLYRSQDGGETFYEMTHWYGGYGYPKIHADQHTIVFPGASADTILVGNDGGVFRTVDGGQSWQSLNNNLNITQFYSGASVPGMQTFYGGAQDNGTLKYTGSGLSWSTVYGGDGGVTAVNNQNTDIVYTEYVHLDIRKSTNGGQSWSSATNGISPAERNDRSLFIAPFVMDPTAPNVLYAGTHCLYKTVDGAANWEVISDDLTFGGSLSAIAVSESSPGTIYTGSSDGKVCMTTNSGAVWTDISSGLPFGRYVTRLAVDYYDSAKVYATFSGYSTGQHVYKSTDAGQTWVNISNNLPDIPVNAIVINRLQSKILYVGTDLGVYESTDGGNTWASANNGMANVVVQDLFLHPDGNGNYNLVAATHGRGMYMTTSVVVPVELSSFDAVWMDNHVKLSWSTESEINNACFDVQRQADSSAFVRIARISGAGTSMQSQDYYFTDSQIRRPRRYRYRLKQVDTDGNYAYSRTIAVDLTQSFRHYQLFPNYPNPFNATTTIQYQIPKAAHVRIQIYNIAGQLIKSIVDEYATAGIHSVKWEAAAAPSGMYLCRIEAGAFQDDRKLILLR